jgi:hypothetical protein
MSNNYDIDLTLPREYEHTAAGVSTSSNNVTSNVQVISKVEVRIDAENINKVKKKLIKGVIKHDGV